MYRQPDIFAITPHMIDQAEGHGGGALFPSLLQTLVRQHPVVETDDQPNASAMAFLTPRVI